MVLRGINERRARKFCGMKIEKTDFPAYFIEIIGKRGKNILKAQSIEAPAGRSFRYNFCFAKITQ